MNKFGVCGKVCEILVGAVVCHQGCGEELGSTVGCLHCTTQGINTDGRD